MNASAWIPILGLVLALSGWGKVLYDHVSARPKVRGRVFNVIRGQTINPADRMILNTSFITYLYLVNQRRNAIHLLDFELEILVGGRWLKLKRVYGLHNAKELNFKAPDGANIEIKNFSDNLINRKVEPVSYGKPLHGWIVFAGDASLHAKDIPKWRITCVDIYKKRHSFTTTTTDFENLMLLQDIADMSIPKSAIPAPRSLR